MPGRHASEIQLTTGEAGIVIGDVPQWLVASLSHATNVESDSRYSPLSRAFASFPLMLPSSTQCQHDVATSKACYATNGHGAMLVPGVGFQCARYNTRASRPTQLIYRLVNYITSEPSLPTRTRQQGHTINPCTGSHIQPVLHFQQQLWPWQTRRPAVRFPRIGRNSP